MGWFSVDNATLNRFFSLHYLLPFIIAAVSLLHIAALHQYGSNNPLGINSEVDKINFVPYFYVKDLVGWVVFALFFSIFVFFAPNVLGTSRQLYTGKSNVYSSAYSTGMVFSTSLRYSTQYS